MEQKKYAEDTVFIGDGYPVDYAKQACEVIAFKGKSEVMIVARGRHISSAVDTVEIAKNRVMEGKLETAQIKIGTEALPSKDKKDGKEFNKNVSFIEITLKKIGC